MTKLWIIRHGQASFGDSDYDKLSDTGILQSRILGRYFKSTGTEFHIAYVGTMKRQIDTADIALSELCQGSRPLKALSEAAFNEYDFKPIITALLPELLVDEPDMNHVLPNIFKDNREFQKMFGKIMDRWVSGRYATPGIETYAQYTGRVREGLVRVTDLEDDKPCIAVFTSGGVISVAMQMALGLSDHEAMRLAWWVKNTSVTLLDYKKGRFNLLYFNLLSHLELENKPELLTYR
ncbi:MAG: phosphoglycerate mutase family protein [Proteobacteria bacterium]|nr:phosphoglycerate mutase family protein [Pseudomonadota bacterium]